MYSTPDFRKGLKIELNGEPFTIVDFLHVKPGKGGAFVRTTLKSLISGNVIDRTFRSGEKIDKPNLEEKQMQYLYESDGEFHFMDSETYEQSFLTQNNSATRGIIFRKTSPWRYCFTMTSPLGWKFPYSLN